MITGINASKMIKYISCECKCKCDRRKCNSNKSGTMVNVDVSVKIIYVEKIIFGILIQVVAKMVNI